jgi:arsenate reductase (thioredoxin)
MNKVFNVLFLSQRNSARSVMAEALLNHFGKGRFRAFSAGVHPTADIEPIVYELLEHAKVPYMPSKPKHYLDFAREASAPLDFVFTLSDTAAGEPMPVWPGQPVSAHWRAEDPARVTNAVESRLALIRVRAELERRLRVFLNLPLASFDRMSLQRQVDDIGRKGAT